MPIPEITLRSMALNALMFTICVVTICLILLHREPKPVLVTSESIKSLQETIKSQQETIELQRRALTLLLERRLVPEPPSRNEVEDIPNL